MGQPDLPADQLAHAPNLRAIINVEGNFFPNVDYPRAFASGVRVLGCGPAYAQAVAEYALGLAIDIARGISREDRAFRARREAWVSASTGDSILLRGGGHRDHRVRQPGAGALPLLLPFRPTLRVYDPWLPDRVLRDAGLEPVPLDEVLRLSTFVFMLATVTPESQAMLDGKRLDLLRPGARLILVSRAALADYPALIERVAAGRFLAAVDVWPEEPLGAEHPARATSRVSCSRPIEQAASLRRSCPSARWCSMTSTSSPGACRRCGCRQPRPSSVGRYRSKPVR